jgi:hypothetical protein
MGTGSERSDVPVPFFAGADVAGKGDRHLEESKPVPSPSANLPRTHAQEEACPGLAPCEWTAATLTGL